jgi:signal transduction histidine kinase
VRKAVQLGALLAAVAVIGVVDDATGPTFGFSLFYLIPIALAGWRAGLPQASVVATVAAAAWLAADLEARPDTPLEASVWNGFTRLVIFNAVAVLLARLRREIAHHEELGRMREELLYSVAHELRNPLGVLENALDILASEGAALSAAEAQRLTFSARRTAGRLHTLMEDLLSAGSIRSGRFAIRPESLPLGAIVADAADVVEPSLRERQQSLAIDVPDAIVVRADRHYIRQVLANLIGNASKYGPPACAIRVAASSGGTDARVVVEDPGPGIRPEDRRDIFERFYRTRQTGQEPGVGLGLAIAKGIVEAHGGRIGIEDLIPSGTRVWFTLPLAEARG